MIYDILRIKSSNFTESFWDQCQYGSLEEIEVAKSALGIWIRGFQKNTEDHYIREVQFGVFPNPRASLPSASTPRQTLTHEHDEAMDTGCVLESATSGRFCGGSSGRRRYPSESWENSSPHGSTYETITWSFGSGVRAGGVASRLRQSLNLRT